MNNLFVFGLFVLFGFVASGVVFNTYMNWFPLYVGFLLAIVLVGAIVVKLRS